MKSCSNKSWVKIQLLLQQNLIHFKMTERSNLFMQYTGKSDVMWCVTHREAVFGTVIHSIFDSWHYEVLWTCMLTILLWYACNYVRLILYYSQCFGHLLVLTSIFQLDGHCWQLYTDRTWRWSLNHQCTQASLFLCWAGPLSQASSTNPDSFLPEQVV